MRLQIGRFKSFMIKKYYTKAVDESCYSSAKAFFLIFFAFYLVVLIVLYFTLRSPISMNDLFEMDIIAWLLINFYGVIFCA